MATATKSLTMHCMPLYKCFKKPVFHFGTNKFAPSVDHIELEYSQGFFALPSTTPCGDSLPIWGQSSGRSKTLEPQNIIHMINSA